MATVDKVLSQLGDLNPVNADDIIQVGNDFKAPTPHRAMSTGYIEGCIATQNVGDPNTIDISPGKGICVDLSNNASPYIKYVEFAGVVSLPLDNINTSVSSYLYIDKNGSVVQTPQYDILVAKESFVISSVAHPTPGVVAGAFPVTHALAKDYMGMFLEHSYCLGPIVQGCGLTIYPNGNNLSLNKSSGTIYIQARVPQALINPPPLYYNDKTPNIVTFPEELNFTWRYVFRDGSGGWTVTDDTNTTLIPGKYDDGTVAVGAEPNGNVGSSNFSVSRIYMLTSGNNVIHYGQQVYSNIDDAINGIETETFIENPVLLESSFRGYLILKGNATDLTNSSQAKFKRAPNTGR